MELPAPLPSTDAILPGEGGDQVLRLLDSITDGFCAFDAEWRFTFINEAAKRWFAPNIDDPGALLGRNHWDVFPDLLGTELEHQYRRGMAERVPIEVEIYYPRWSRWYFIRGFPVPGGGLSIYFRDTTDEKQVKEELRARDENYRPLLDALATSQQKVDLILGAVAEGIHGLDAEGRIVFENAAATAMFGWTQEEMIGRRAHDLIHHHRADGSPYPAGECQIYQTLRDGLTRRVGDEVFFRKDGSSFPVEYVCSPLRNGAGAVAGAVVTFQDVTERQQAEKALREAEAKYRSIFENSNDGIFQNTPDGRFLSANPALARILGFASPEELIRERTDIERQGYANPSLREEFKRRLEERDVIKGFEYEVARKDGTRIWVSESTRVVRDAGGRALYYEGSVQDITERKQAEAVRRRLAAIVNSSDDAIMSLDLHEKVTSWNAGAERVFGFSAREMIGASVTRLIPPEGLEEERKFMARVKHGERVEHFETVRVTKDGGLIDVSVSVSLIRDTAGFVTGMSKIARDITERKQAERHRRAWEEAERANSAKSDFLSRMSHELRTPLNAILGFGQLLELESLTGHQLESVRHIMTGGRHLLKLIDQVLDIARAESGHAEVSLEPVEIGEVARECLGLIGPLAARRGVKLDAPGLRDHGTGRDEGVFVFADRQRLIQVLLNLLNNAVKYNVQGGRVKLESAVARGRLRLRVADTGPGITPVKRARLFTPFDRLGAERGEVEGTGLGLALSKGLMEAMGGGLGLEESAVGSGEGGLSSGSVFWIELPLTTAPTGELPITVDWATCDPAPSEPMPAGRTLLYIEDNLANLMLIERLLEAHKGVRLLTATRGGMGLDLARSHHPDLILLDLQLPDLPGEEVFARLRADEGTRDIPVVIISADATTRQTENLLRAGARGYLTKPLVLKELLAVIRSALLKRGG